MIPSDTIELFRSTERNADVLLADALAAGLTRTDLEGLDMVISGLSDVKNDIRLKLLIAIRDGMKEAPNTRDRHAAFLHCLETHADIQELIPSIAGKYVQNAEELPKRNTGFWTTEGIVRSEIHAERDPERQRLLTFYADLSYSSALRTEPEKV